MAIEIHQAIEMLEELGYTFDHEEMTASLPVEDPDESEYAEFVEAFEMWGEEWENDPETYVADMGDDQDDYYAAFEFVDLDAMVVSWDDQTLRDVVRYGSDLAFDKPQRLAMQQACAAEIGERYPLRRRIGHGIEDYEE